MSRRMSVLLIGDIKDARLAPADGDLLDSNYAELVLYTAPDWNSGAVRLDQGDIDVLLLGLDVIDNGHPVHDLVSHVRERWPEMPIVAVGGPEIGSRAARLIQSGAQECLAGPVHEIQALADVVACAVERKRLELEREKRLEYEKEQRALNEVLLRVGAALNSTLNYEEVLDLILQLMELVLPYDAADIMLINGETMRALRWRGYERFGGEAYISQVKYRVDEIENHLRMQRSGLPVAIPDVESYAAWVQRPEVTWIKSYIGAPIIIDDRVIGFLNANSSQPNHFKESDAWRLRDFAEWAAVAIHNAQLYQQTRRELADRKRAEVALQHRLLAEELVSQISTRFVTLSPEAYSGEIDRTLQAIARFAAVDCSYLLLFAGEAGGPDSVPSVERSFVWYHAGIEGRGDKDAAPGLAELAWALPSLRAGKVLQVWDVDDLPDETSDGKRLLMRRKVRSLLVVPLLEGGGLVGLLGLNMMQIRRRWTDSDLRLFRLIGEVLTNVLVRQRVAEALRTSENRYRAIVEDQSEFVCRWLPDGRLTFANSAYCQRYGLRCEQTVEWNWLERFSPEDQERILGRIAEWRRSSNGDDNRVVTSEYPETLNDLGTRWVQWTERPIFDDDGTLKEIQGVGRDITDRKMAEEALRQSEQNYRRLALENAALLEQASRDAETKATLLREVNHRVKNNLTGIIGLLYAEQFRDGADEAEGHESIVQKMTCRIQGMATVHSMLTASQWAPLSLSDLIERIIHATVQIMARSHRPLVQVQPCQVLVTPDQAHSLALVINELATNSLKHAFDAQTLGEMQIDVSVEKGMVAIAFGDNGPGYPEAVLGGDQTGVGLYLVQNIVRKELRGSVSLSNASTGALTSIHFEAALADER